MKLYTAAQIREWDAFTIAHEPVSSINLMERAAEACVGWLLQQFGAAGRYLVVCGKGNNGGDGLAIARLLHAQGAAVAVCILETGAPGSPDFQINLQRLRAVPVSISFVSTAELLPTVGPEAVIVDALFGTGLNRPLQGLSASLVRHLNQHSNKIVAIDVPSGLLLHAPSDGESVVRATYTLSFAATKMAFLLPQNSAFTGTVVVLDIKLHPGYQAAAPYELLQPAFLKTVLQPRSRFGHKGTFGHGLLIGGSRGKIGAVVLAAKALLRSGVGLATVLVPACGYTVLQTAVPEAMTMTADEETKIASIAVEAERFSAIGVGPGMGTAPATQEAFAQFLKKGHRPLVLDADALNCLALQPYLLQQVPPGSILTPHPKEFERLFGACKNDFERIEKAAEWAAALNVIIVLKGHHTFIAAPTGPHYFNSTGNAGMATGGSGDVLTGLLTGLLAQGYEPLQAALLGVFLHGRAGDLAAAARSEEALIAGDLAEAFGAAFRSIAAG